MASQRTEIEVLSDLKIVIEGVEYHEKKEVERIFKEENGVETWILQIASHSRKIGDKWWTGTLHLTQQMIDDGVIKQNPDTSNMTEEELLRFNKDWIENFHLVDDSPFDLCSCHQGVWVRSTGNGIKSFLLAGIAVLLLGLGIHLIQERGY